MDTGIGTIVERRQSQRQSRRCGGAVQQEHLDAKFRRETSLNIHGIGTNHSDQHVLRNQGGSRVKHRQVDIWVLDSLHFVLSMRDLASRKTER